MKYDSLRNLKRNTELRLYAQEHPEATLKVIGKVFGISKQRAWVIQKGEQK